VNDGIIEGRYFWRMSFCFDGVCRGAGETWLR
jgi:hypothetical protein